MKTYSYYVQENSLHPAKSVSIKTYAEKQIATVPVVGEFYYKLIIEYGKRLSFESVYIYNLIPVSDAECILYSLWRNAEGSDNTVNNILKLTEMFDNSCLI